MRDDCMTCYMTGRTMCVWSISLCHLYFLTPEYRSCHLFPSHDDIIKWKRFPRYWPFVRGIHRSPVNSPHKDQWHGALMFYLICPWINRWVNNPEAGDLKRHRAHYDVSVVGNTILFQKRQTQICYICVWDDKIFTGTITIKYITVILC